MVIKVSLEVGGGAIGATDGASGSGDWYEERHRWTVHRRLSIPLQFDADNVPLKGYVISLLDEG